MTHTRDLHTKFLLKMIDRWSEMRARPLEEIRASLDVTFTKRAEGTASELRDLELFQKVILGKATDNEEAEAAKLIAERVAAAREDHVFRVKLRDSHRKNAARRNLITPAP